jgi:hypothetical protein
MTDKSSNMTECLFTNKLISKRNTNTSRFFAQNVGLHSKIQYLFCLTIDNLYSYFSQFLHFGSHCHLVIFRCKLTGGSEICRTFKLLPDGMQHNKSFIGFLDSQTNITWYTQNILFG